MDTWRPSWTQEMLILSLLYSLLAKYTEGFNWEVDIMPIMPEVCESQPKKWPDKTLPLGPEVPLHPWIKLASDICHFNGTDYLLVADYMSRFFVTHQLTSQTSKNVVQQMKSIFFEYTPSQTLITDNGLCYASKEFKEFIKDYNIEHIMSSPHYHKGNGVAEKYIDIVKNPLQKAADAKQDPCSSTRLHHSTTTCHHHWNCSTNVFGLIFQ